MANPRRSGRHTRAAVDARDEAVTAPPERPAVPTPEFGPFDVEAAFDDGISRVDLGALRIPTVPGVGLQLEAASSGQVVRVHLEHDGSRLQLSALAAPRTDGIWDEFRAELRTNLLSGGSKVVEVEGEYGPELAARQPAAGGGVLEARYIGIDGPRWFVLAVLIGPAAVDPDRAEVLKSVLRGVVVDRGKEARPVKEMLPLRLPPELAAQLAQRAEAQKAQAGGAAPAGPNTSGGRGEKR